MSEKKQEKGNQTETSADESSIKKLLGEVCDFKYRPELRVFDILHEEMTYFEPDDTVSVCDSDIVMEYIGLTDNDDKKIFTLDIMDSTKYPGESSSYIVLKENGAYRKLYIEGWDLTLSKPILDIQSIGLLNDKIIGNVLENPELWQVMDVANFA